MLGNVGPGEVLLIFLVVLLVFGAKRLPEIARGLGQGIREFRSATREISREFTDDPAVPRRTSPPLQPPVPVRAPEVDVPFEVKPSA